MYNQNQAEAINALIVLFNVGLKAGAFDVNHADIGIQSIKFLESDSKQALESAKKDAGIDPDGLLGDDIADSAAKANLQRSENIVGRATVIKDSEVKKLNRRPKK